MWHVELCAFFKLQLYLYMVFINERESNDIFSILNLFFLSTET